MTTSVITGLPAPSGSSSALRRSLLATFGLRQPAGAAPPVVIVIARSVYATVARAYTFFLPGTGAAVMMALPTNPARSAWIGKHEVNQAYQLDLTNGLNSEALAASNAIAPILLEIKSGQTTADVTTAKLRAWSVSGSTLTFVIGDGAQKPGYTYMAGAYVTTAAARIFEVYIAIPCPVEPGL